MSKEVKELFVHVIVLIEQIMFLVLAARGDFPQPGHGVMIGLLIALIAYFSYQTIQKATAVVKTQRPS